MINCFHAKWYIMVYLHCTFVITIYNLLNSNINIWINIEIKINLLNTADNSYMHVTLLSYRLGHLWPLNGICYNLIQKQLKLWCWFGVSLVVKSHVYRCVIEVTVFLKIPIRIILYYCKMKNGFFLFGTCTFLEVRVALLSNIFWVPNGRLIFLRLSRSLHFSKLRLFPR